jgi:hypothetical protein
MSILWFGLGYAISLGGGGLLARYWVVFLKKRIDPQYDSTTRLGVLDWSLGILERAITTTLIIWAPTLAAPFIGGWVALKFAANWEKRDVDGDFHAQQQIARHRLTGIVGSTISIVVAVAVGLALNPHAIQAWTPDSHQVHTVRVVQ